MPLLSVALCTLGFYAALGDCLDDGASFVQLHRYEPNRSFAIQEALTQRSAAKALAAVSDAKILRFKNMVREIAKRTNLSKEAQGYMLIQAAGKVMEDDHVVQNDIDDTDGEVRDGVEGTSYCSDRIKPMTICRGSSVNVGAQLMGIVSSSVGLSYKCDKDDFKDDLLENKTTLGIDARVFRCGVDISSGAGYLILYLFRLYRGISSATKAAVAQSQLAYRLQATSAAIWLANSILSAATGCPEGKRLQWGCAKESTALAAYLANLGAVLERVHDYCFDKYGTNERRVEYDPKRSNMFRRSAAAVVPVDSNPGLLVSPSIESPDDDDLQSIFSEAGDDDDGAAAAAPPASADDDVERTDGFEEVHSNPLYDLPPEDDDDAAVVPVPVPGSDDDGGRDDDDEVEASGLLPGAVPSSDDDDNDDGPEEVVPFDDGIDELAGSSDDDGKDDDDDFDSDEMLDKLLEPSPGYGDDDVVDDDDSGESDDDDSGVATDVVSTPVVSMIDDDDSGVVDPDDLDGDDDSGDDDSDDPSSPVEELSDDDDGPEAPGSDDDDGEDKSDGPPKPIVAWGED